MSLCHLSQFPNIYFDPITFKQNSLDDIQPNNISTQTLHQNAVQLQSFFPQIILHAQTNQQLIQNLDINNLSQRAKTSIHAILFQSIPVLPKSRDNLTLIAGASRRRIAAAIVPLLELQILIEKGGIALTKNNSDRQSVIRAQIIENSLQSEIILNYKNYYDYYQQLLGVHENLSNLLFKLQLDVPKQNPLFVKNYLHELQN
ncbi:hypothetical protein SS50377_23147 [Spironucleus salmonicida]|uniref:Uncharacterized protein n=1 Tax=Spironucleus salmonicida TaxID=348837 RepID=V6LBU8_9EUKA|nr:hypothetical protein SS50377_23147 [Spironucleus salmonicida]|eukprot:EST41678.1 Hypothetical protein SS50377_18765 [Spironucleus salmonicida]